MTAAEQLWAPSSLRCLLIRPRSAGSTPPPASWPLEIAAQLQSIDHLGGDSQTGGRNCRFEGGDFFFFLSPTLRGKVGCRVRGQLPLRPLAAVSALPLPPSPGRSVFVRKGEASSLCRTATPCDTTSKEATPADRGSASHDD